MTGECPTTWLAESRLVGSVVVRVGRRGNDLIAEFANFGKLTTSSGGTRPHFEPMAGVSAAALDKLRDAVVDAFVRHAQGKLTFHGGAVSFDSKTVALIGPNRSGKSTLTAALCADPEMGLMGDDTVAIELSEGSCECVEVLRTQRVAWLLPDTRRALGLEAVGPGKMAVPLRSPTSERLVLAAVVGLSFDSNATMPKLRRLRGQEAFATLFNAAFRFVVDDPAAQLQEFDQLRVVVQRCPVYELRRPRDLSNLKHSEELIRELLAGTCPAERKC